MVGEFPGREAGSALEMLLFPPTAHSLCCRSNSFRVLVRRHLFTQHCDSQEGLLSSLLSSYFMKCKEAAAINLAADLPLSICSGERGQQARGVFLYPCSGCCLYQWKYWAGEAAFPPASPLPTFQQTAAARIHTECQSSAQNHKFRNNSL